MFHILQCVGDSQTINALEKGINETFNRYTTKVTEESGQIVLTVSNEHPINDAASNRISGWVSGFVASREHLKAIIQDIGTPIRHYNENGADWIECRCCGSTEDDKNGAPEMKHAPGCLYGSPPAKRQNKG